MILKVSQEDIDVIRVVGWLSQIYTLFNSDLFGLNAELLYMITIMKCDRYGHPRASHSAHDWVHSTLDATILSCFLWGKRNQNIFCETKHFFFQERDLFATLYKSLWCPSTDILQLQWLMRRLDSVLDFYCVSPVGEQGVQCPSMAQINTVNNETNPKKSDLMCCRRNLTPELLKVTLIWIAWRA